MRTISKLLPVLILLALFTTSCVTKKKYRAMQTSWKTQLDAANADLGKCGVQVNDLMAKLSACEADRTTGQTNLRFREEQMADLRTQLADCQAQRDVGSPGTELEFAL